MLQPLGTITHRLVQGWHNPMMVALLFPKVIVLLADKAVRLILAETVDEQ